MGTRVRFAETVETHRVSERREERALAPMPALWAPYSPGEPLLRPLPRAFAAPPLHAPSPETELYAWALEADAPAYRRRVRAPGIDLGNLSRVFADIEASVTLDDALVPALRAWVAELLAGAPVGERLVARGANVPTATDLALAATFLSVELAKHKRAPAAILFDTQRDRVVHSAAPTLPGHLLNIITPDKDIHFMVYTRRARIHRNIENYFLFGFYVSNLLRTKIPTFQFVLGALEEGRAELWRPRGEVFGPGEPAPYVLAEYIDAPSLDTFIGIYPAPFADRHRDTSEWLFARGDTVDPLGSIPRRGPAPEGVRGAVYDVVMQVLLALQVLAEHDAYAAHHALALRNVRVQDLGAERVVTFPVGGGAVRLRTRYLARITNFENASARITPTDVWLGEADDALALFPGAPNRVHDVALFLGELVSATYAGTTRAGAVAPGAIGVEWLAQIAAPPGWLERVDEPDEPYAGLLHATRFANWGYAGFSTAGAPVGVDLLDLAYRGLTRGVPAVRALGVPGVVVPAVSIENVKIGGEVVNEATPTWAPAPPLGDYPATPLPLAFAPLAENQKFEYIPLYKYVIPKYVKN